MKRTFTREDYDFDESVFFIVEKYGETERFEITGVSYLFYETSAKPTISLQGYVLTKTGRRRKADTRPTWVYVPKQVYEFNGFQRVWADTLAVALEANALKYWEENIKETEDAGTAVSA